MRTGSNRSEFHLTFLGAQSRLPHPLRGVAGRKGRLLIRACSALLLIALSLFAFSCILTPEDTDDDLLTGVAQQAAIEIPGAPTSESNFALHEKHDQWAFTPPNENAPDKVQKFEPLETRFFRNQFLLGPLDGRAPPSALLS